MERDHRDHIAILIAIENKVLMDIASVVIQAKDVLMEMAGVGTFTIIAKQHNTHNVITEVVIVFTEMVRMDGVATTAPARTLTTIKELTHSAFLMM